MEPDRPPGKQKVTTFYDIQPTDIFPRQHCRRVAAALRRLRGQRQRQPHISRAKAGHRRAERRGGRRSARVGLLPASSAEPALHAFLRILHGYCASVMDPGGPSAAEIDLETLMLALIGYGGDQ